MYTPWLVNVGWRTNAASKPLAGHHRPNKCQNNEFKKKEAVVEYSRVESSIPAFQYSSECTVRQVFTMIASVSTQEADAEHTSHIYNITQTQG